MDNQNCPDGREESKTEIPQRLEHLNDSLLELADRLNGLMSTLATLSTNSETSAHTPASPEDIASLLT